MVRGWYSVTVELLGGRAEALWPPPGRVFAVGPSHTFAQLGEAIDLAFARWDLSHRRRFDLSDGQVVTDQEAAEDMTHAKVGEPIATLDIATARVLSTLEPGTELRYVFDLGDVWTHRLTVGTESIDPETEVGLVPMLPTAYQGGGTIPDQYGRRWLEDDAGAPPPAYEHPMLRREWPAPVRTDVDPGELRVAVAEVDGDAIIAALTDRNLDHVLQLAGHGAQLLLESGHPGAREVTDTVVAGLRTRDWAGDDVLLEDLLAQLNGTPIAARSLPVDLEDLAYALGDTNSDYSSFLDLQTGEVIPGVLTQVWEVGEENAVDIDADPDRYLRVESESSRAAWQDMADFVSELPAGEPRDTLDRAIEGRGAFRRFKDEVGRSGLLDRWHPYSDDRQRGRAREWLASEDIRVAVRDPGRR